MAQTTILCATVLLFLVFSFTCGREDYVKSWEAKKALQQYDAHKCTDDVEMCKCLAAKPGRCESDVEIRGACAASCKACDEKKRNLYLASLINKRSHFVRDSVLPGRRGCFDKIEDCDCMLYMCTLDEFHKTYMKDVCPSSCGFC